MKPLIHWSGEGNCRIIGIFTDIDDTLTTQGSITRDALRALSDLKEAGFVVIPITGRPIGWCTPFMEGQPGDVWPVDAIVAENGAVAYVREGALPLRKLYQQDAATRAANQGRIREIAAKVAAEVPGVELSRDDAGRETDIAFDYAEFARHSPDKVQQVLDVLHREGMQTTVSSIHIHGCFGDFNNWQGACWIVQELWGRDLTQELHRWVFIGDSGNDQDMFEHFPHSVGVANIARFVPHLTHLPRYVTAGERGAGFAELARLILSRNSR